MGYAFLPSPGMSTQCLPGRADTSCTDGLVLGSALHIQRPFLIGSVGLCSVFMFVSCHVLSLTQADRRDWEGEGLSWFLPLI